ncbi:dephospho-CoA kinase [Allomuricauda sp. d1]|uniref:dephospho-CoA kinase n=1 Tax=Allomuricauda sp. d1 TaxID=3136725 RepID=UPI0031DEC6A2
MKIVGLTGGIGSGKSFVAAIFKELDIPVYDSDLEAKRLMHSSSPLKEAIIGLLGENAYYDEGLNRAFVAEKVFGNSKLLSDLNAIVHPAVKEHFLNWCKNQNAPYVIQETALIFENNIQDRYDAIILVVAPEALRIKRVMQRDDQTKKQVLMRMGEQLDDGEKRKHAHFIIDNVNADLTREQVHKIHEAIVADAKGH